MWARIATNISKNKQRNQTDFKFNIRSILQGMKGTQRPTTVRDSFQSSEATKPGNKSKNNGWCQPELNSTSIRRKTQEHSNRLRCVTPANWAMQYVDAVVDAIHSGSHSGNSSENNGWINERKGIERKARCSHLFHAGNRIHTGPYNRLVVDLCSWWA